VRKALGLDTAKFSLPYVSLWANGQNALKTVTQTGERIRKAAAMILGRLLPTQTQDAEIEDVAA
jgi:hypothetical protein